MVLPIEYILLCFSQVFFICNKAYIFNQTTKGLVTSLHAGPVSERENTSCHSFLGCRCRPGLSGFHDIRIHREHKLLWGSILLVAREWYEVDICF